jgi:hypothetical protein
MRVKVLGFNLLIEGGINGARFFEWIESQSPLKPEPQRRLAITRDGEYWKGLLLTVRDVRHFTQIQEAGGQFILTTETMKDGAHPADANFFIVHASTLRGLYLHYFHSASLNTLCYELKHLYDELRRLEMERAVEALCEPSTRELIETKRRYRKSLKYTILVRPGTLEDCVEELDRIKSFTFQYSELRPIVESFRPIASTALRVTHRAVFSKSGTLEAQKQAVVDLIKSNVLRTASVVGMDPSEHEVTYRLTHDLASLGEYDYDKLADGLKVNSADLISSIRTCPMVQTLVEMAAREGLSESLETPVSKDKLE